MKNIIAAIRSLPRAAQWGLLAAVVFGLYFLVIEPVMTKTERLAARADRLESDLRRASDFASPDSSDGQFLIRAVKAFGTPRLPSDPDARPDSIQRVIDKILDDHDIADRTKIERSATLTGDLVGELAGAARIERYIVEVSFEADQHTVASVIADLEREPAVSAISRIKIDRATAYSARDESAPRLVRATIAAEAWVRVRSSSTPSDSDDTDSL